MNVMGQIPAGLRPNNEPMRWCPECDVYWSFNAPQQCWLCGQQGKYRSISTWRNAARWSPGTEMWS